MSLRAKTWSRIWRSVGNFSHERGSSRACGSKVSASTFAECIRWMAGAKGWEEGDGIISRDSYQRFNFPRVATYIRCMRAALSPCFALGEPSLVSIAQSRFMELDVEGDVVKYAAMHAEGIVAISLYYPIRSNSSKKSNLESLVAKIEMRWTLIYVKNKIYYFIKDKVFCLSKLKTHTSKLY